MSYGFHRLGSNQDPGKARKALTAILFADLKPVITYEPPAPVVIAAPPPAEPPRVADTLIGVATGYSGDVCDTCQGSRLRWAGHCKVCEDCGTTTGCS